MEKNRIEDLALINQKYRELSDVFTFFPEKIVNDEDELAIIMGRNFSLSTLESARRKSVNMIDYTQKEKGSRVLYPILGILETLTGVNLANKREWYRVRIQEITASHFVNSNQLAKLLSVSPSTIKAYQVTGYLPKFDRKKLFNVYTIADHIVSNTIKSTYNS